MAGVFCLLEGLTSVFGQLIVPGMFLVSGDAAATATKMQGRAFDQKAFHHRLLKPGSLPIALITPEMLVAEPPAHVQMRPGSA